MEGKEKEEEKGESIKQYTQKKKNKKRINKNYLNAQMSLLFMLLIDEINLLHRDSHAKLKTSEQYTLGASGANRTMELSCKLL